LWSRLARVLLLVLGRLARRLVGDGARDRLPYPPGGVGRKLVTALILEFLDRFHQADIAFLDQIEEVHAAIDVTLEIGRASCRERV